MTFDDFWALYPRHDAKKDCRKAWDRLNPDPALQHQIAVALAWQVHREQWQDERFIPLPASWLRGERWEDEPKQAETSRAEYERWRFAGGCKHDPRCAHFAMCRIVSMRDPKAS